MAEEYFIDPPELLPDRTELHLTPVMTPAGIDYPTSTYQPFWADGDLGQVDLGQGQWLNRELTIPLIPQERGGTAMATWRSLLQAKVGELQRARYGVLKRVTASGGTVYADILSARLKLGGDSLQAIRDFDVNASIDLVLSPESYGPEVGDLREDFSVDTIASGEWSVELGSGTIAIAGGELVPSSTAEKRLVRTDREFYDVQVLAKVTVGASADVDFAPICKYLDVNNFVRVDLRGTANVLRVAKFDGSRFTSLAAAAFTPVARTIYWVRARIEGNRIIGDVFTGSVEPTQTSVPDQTVSYTLTGADATKFGQGVRGSVGLRMTPAGTDARYDDFLAQPNVFTGTGEIIAPIYGIDGDFPPGNRCRVVVTDTSGNDQRGLICAFRSRNYDSASTAALSYEAEALTPLDTARGTALAGASGGTAVTHPSPMSSWTPVCGGTAMTHAGGYRMLARVHSPGGSDVSLRAVWDVGDLVFPSENPRWTFPDADQFYLADLGAIRLQRPPTDDDYSWAWQIQALAAAGGEAVSIDRVWLEPVGEFMARLSSTQGSARALTGFTARDGFNQTAGNLSGKTLEVGGTWSGAGDADDFTIDTTLHQAKRSANSDSGSSPLVGRAALASSTAGMTNQAASVDFKISALPTSPRYIAAGLILRYTDARNFLVVLVNMVGSVEQLQAMSVIAGVAQFVDIGPSWRNPLVGTTGTIGWTLTANVTSYGSINIDIGPTGTVKQSLVGANAALATGGALARGSAGIYDLSASPGSEIRYYDNFACWVPSADAVIYANRSAELRTDGFYRQDATGRRSGPVSNAVGNLPRLPASGVTGNPTELFVKTSRGDLDRLPDPALDALEAQVLYRPCWLGVPGG